MNRPPQKTPGIAHSSQCFRGSVCGQSRVSDYVNAEVKFFFCRSDYQYVVLFPTYKCSDSPPAQLSASLTFVKS
ncbi:hypothetical protein Y032_0765g2164 [Ancylostoma ceylanicum]|uniref:Uncharacterized protein n=1 Tax=Ancylostoma ceylanicum TaxID=53326 RepID=A0A016WD83_9BILA|nr:hypothetical protein Y032_0765g2164 [Ancylostoma ceylanicum]